MRSDDVCGNQAAPQRHHAQQRSASSSRQASRRPPAPSCRPAAAPAGSASFEQLAGSIGNKRSHLAVWPGCCSVQRSPRCTPWRLSSICRRPARPRLSAPPSRSVARGAHASGAGGLSSVERQDTAQKNTKQHTAVRCFQRTANPTTEPRRVAAGIARLSEVHGD